ncbi:glycosyltransferase [Streptacidiphilus monticola]|uniref:D-inositol 3-phosphate glycosyltransferase n=1 Tax=Streptacidiphilus monticola TaxID=2161674 RepID=A0ABW1G394_9ACTN
MTARPFAPIAGSGPTDRNGQIGRSSGTAEAAPWPAADSTAGRIDGLPPQPALRRIKVLHVITRFWAGAGGNTLLTATGMDPGRYEVWVAGAPGGDLWERARAAGVRTVEIPGFRAVIGPGDALVLWRLVRLLRRERFTIVHTHSAKAGFLGRLAARLCGTPVVVHTFHGLSFHDRMPPSRRRLYRRLERLAGRGTHAFIAVAPTLAREAVENRLAPPGSVQVIPSAVELDAIPTGFDRAARDSLGVAADRPLIGTVGRLDTQKAPLDFVAMAAAVHARHGEVAFVVVGDGPLADAARESAAHLGVEVRFLGWRSDAHRLVAGFDVFVISSWYEGLGRALTEALAAARPVVATAVNGVPDLVEPGVCGLLAEPGDPAGLARAVCWLLEHPEQAKAMAERGRARVRASFSPEQMCAAVDRCYRRQLGLL